MEEIEKAEVIVDRIETDQEGVRYAVIEIDGEDTVSVKLSAFPADLFENGHYIIHFRRKIRTYDDSDGFNKIEILSAERIADTENQLKKQNREKLSALFRRKK